MINSKNNKDYFQILQKISKKPQSSQRQLSQELGFSLGKLNYCLKRLQKKGLIKIQNFKKNKNKMNYFYILTPRGVSKKTKLTLDYIKKTIKEYDQLKIEYEKLKNMKKN